MTNTEQKEVSYTICHEMVTTQFDLGITISHLPLQPFGEDTAQCLTKS